MISYCVLIMFCAKMYKTLRGTLVAICDSDLLGLELEHEGRTIKVSPTFYCDKKITAEEAILLMRGATCLNLLGNKIIEIALKKGYIHKDSIMYLKTQDGEKIAYAIVQLINF